MFRLICPQRWDELTPTAEPGVRECGQCDRRVYLCTTDSETIAHARAGDCIAREMPDSSEAQRLYLGKPEFPEPPATPRQIAAAPLIDREVAIDDAIENVRYSTRSCPRCEYPAPDWRVCCRVCGFHFGRVPPRQGPNDELEQR
jgi:hypothetical protein